MAVNDPWKTVMQRPPTERVETIDPGTALAMAQMRESLQVDGVNVRLPARGAGVVVQPKASDFQAPERDGFEAEELEALPPEVQAQMIAGPAIEYGPQVMDPHRVPGFLVPPTVGGAVPMQRIILSWGRDPSRIVVGIERVSDGEVLLTRSVTIEAWRQVAPLVALLAKTKDLTGGEWEEDDEPRPTARRGPRTARAASSAHGGGRNQSSPSPDAATGRRGRSLAALATGGGRDDSTGTGDGSTGSGDAGPDVPADGIATGGGV